MRKALFTIPKLGLQAGRRLGPLRMLTLILGLLCSGGLVKADGWGTSCVDCPKYLADLTEHSLRLNAGGWPCIAYGGDHLYYAWHSGTSWHYEAVDLSPDVGAHPSLALDASGYPHISYEDQNNIRLKYAYRDASGWHVEVIGSVSRLSTHSSMALDQEGRPHVSYGTPLKYAYRDAQGWHTQVVEDWIEVQGTSIAVDEDGNPRILYFVSQSGDSNGLKYAYRDGTGWHVETVGLPTRTDTSLSLALDTNGIPHISYSDNLYLNTALQYGYRDGSGWHTSALDSGGDYSRYHPSLTLDALGYPHVAYFFQNWQDAELPELRHAYRDRFGWHTEVVDARGTRSPSLVLDSQGHPHLAYQDERTLRYIHKDGLGWHGELVDEGSAVGEEVSLAVDDSAVLHISYLDWTSKDLKYARSSGNTWQIETVASDGQVGIGASLALNGQGEPCLTYYDDTALEVLYSCRTSAGWQQAEIIDTHAQYMVSQDHGTSLAFDAAGKPHVTYRGTYGLRYARREAGGWQIEAPEESCSYCGHRSSLVVDASGNPHIGYCDTYNDTLRYSFRDLEGWHSEPVSWSAEWCGGDVSLRLDDNQRPHMSFREGGNQTSYLRYAYKDDSGAWHVETAPGVGYADTTLALDADGNAHIAYLGLADGRSAAYALNRAYWNGTGWQVESVADVGSSTSTALVFDGTGTLLIAYQDSARRDLRYAFYIETNYALHLPVSSRQSSR